MISPYYILTESLQTRIRWKKKNKKKNSPASYIMWTEIFTTLVMCEVVRRFGEELRKELVKKEQAKMTEMQKNLEAKSKRLEKKSESLVERELQILAQEASLDSMMEKYNTKVPRTKLWWEQEADEDTLRDLEEEEARECDGIWLRERMRDPLNLDEDCVY